MNRTHPRRGASRSWIGLVVALAAHGAAASNGRDVRADDPVPPDVLAAERSRIEAIERATKAAVCVFGPDGKGGGSGVVISPDGYALTNFHVVQPCGHAMTCGMADGRVYNAVLVGVDPTGDVGLIQLLGRTDFPVAEWADSDTVRVGDWCFAVGNPFLLATDLQPTVSYGIVSGVHRYQYPAGTLLEYADCIQTDAAINPGNSGGPLFNSDGHLIGINGRGSFEKRGRVNVGVGYAITTNQIRMFLGQLRSGRIVDHATLGATVGSDDRGRVIVSNILASSDAFRRGLRYGDEILSFGGRRITTVNGFKNALGIYPRGWRVPIAFQRGGERFDTVVRLAGVHAPDELFDSVQRPIAPERPKPEPKPGRDGDKKEPAPGEPRPGPPDAPDHPAPETPPGHPGGAVRKVPDEVAARFEARRGYANHFYNRMNRDRVWNQFVAHGSFAALTGDWAIRGDAAGSKVEIEWTEGAVFGRFPDGPSRIDTTAELGAQLQPIGSGGLLVALHLWRRMLQLGPGKFGEVHYWGEAPLPGRAELCDVLVATHDVIECHFYFEPVSGRMVAMEMIPDSESDACAIQFDDYQSVDGREVPRLLRILYGDLVFAEIQVAELVFAPQSDKTESDKADGNQGGQPKAGGAPATGNADSPERESR
ncbi:MAG: PDZ domain-containing protein [Planctomycetes bacterium]|nr:PDZ domain-containing protein [Planctomycetota bacterium]